MHYPSHGKKMNESYTNNINNTRAQQRLISTEITATARCFRTICSIAFFIHLITAAILAIFLTIYGLLMTSKNHHFHPKKWYLPLLASIPFGGIIAFTWQYITSINPSKLIKLAFWFTPILCLSLGALFILIGSPGSLAAGVFSVASSFFLSIYACYVNPRLPFSIQILSDSTFFPPHRFFVFLSINLAVLYSAFLACGIGGAIASETGFTYLFVLFFILSLFWTMQVIKNTMQVTISRVKYLSFACGIEMSTRPAFRDTFKYLTGSVSIGSVIGPFFSLIYGISRGINLMGGDTDEFMFSCADCCSGIGSRLIRRGNRWGFVHVGVYNKGFCEASVEVWDMFKRVGLEDLIDSDLTGSLCFLCGVAGGALCGLVSGIWALVVHKTYATEVAIYAFLIGYFLCRVGMAWPQACVSAYYVAYAANPQSLRFDSTIPVRVQELQRSRVSSVERDLT